MNVFHLIAAELKEIFSKPRHIEFMLAVMCIPLLYAGIFLYGFWNAYGNSGSLPVAVVNQDQGAKISGKQINAGKDLVNQLKKNHDLKWEFVGNRQAENGFKNNHYFMTVNIPANFSKNATTLVDQQLKPSTIHYQVNKDYNFVSSKMVTSGLQQMKARVSSAITKTYAKTMYRQLDQLTKGMEQASAGAGKLSSGSKKELAGLNKLKNGFQSLMNGTTKLQNGTGSLASGASQLSNGANRLSSGASAVSNGAGKLSTGASSLSGGANKIASGNTQLSSGSGKLANGATALSNGAGRLGQGINRYTGAVGNQLLPGANKLTSGLNQLNGGIQNQNLVGQVNQLNSGMQEFYSIIQGLPAQINNSINPATIGEKASQSINISAISEQAVQDAENHGLKKQISESANKTAGEITNTINQQMTTPEAQNQLNTNLNNNEKLKQIIVGIIQKSKGTVTVSDLQGLVTASAGETASTISSQISGSSNNIATKINSDLLNGTEQTIRSTAGQTAQNLVPQVASQTANNIKNGISDQLAQRDPTTGLTLNSAAQRLASGTSQLAGSNGIPMIASSVNQLTNGAGQLSGGLSTLNGNSSALTSGAAAVTNGASSLASGASSLSGGASTLANGASNLAGGADSLANGASSLSSGSQQLVGGTKRLSSGAGTLNSGANALASGLNSVASGQQRLASGTNQAATGAKQIYSGNTKLANNLSSAHDQLAKTPTNNAHAQKFSSPVKTIDGTHQAVDTFGSGFTPYFMNIGLFLGALLLTIVYDLYRPAGLATAGWNIALSKFFITILMSVAQSFLVDLAMIKGLGLHISDPWAFFGFTILLSMSFMAIIQWLAGSFNNEGRFAAIVLLLFQLVTCGGAYSIQLIPHWLQALSPLLPFTYGVNGLRNLIDGHQQQMLAQNSMALVVFILIGVGLSVITYTIKYNTERAHRKANRDYGETVSE